VVLIALFALRIVARAAIVILTTISVFYIVERLVWLLLETARRKRVHRGQTANTLGAFSVTFVASEDRIC
jgi:hypothetical protein